MNIKRIQNSFIMLIMCAIIVSFLQFPASAKYFSDIPSSFWGKDGVNYVADNEIMNGTSPTQFSPNTYLNRAMAVTALYRLAGSPTATGSLPFTDVPSNAYYTNAVKWAYSNGIVNGITPTQFSPNSNIKRQDMVVIISRYAIMRGYTGTSNSTSVLNAFSDKNLISSYAIKEMAWAVQTGIISGTSSGLLDPLGNVTRAQFATILTRYGTNIERIRPKKDNFGFVNSASYFTSTKYFMTNNHVEKMRTRLASIYGENSAIVKMHKFNLERQKEWGGSCYGISAVEALDRLGKIAFNENYSSGKKNLYAMNYSIAGTRAESAINYYHLSQYVLQNPYGDSAAGGWGGLINEIDHAYNIVKSSKSYTMMSIFYTGNAAILGHTFIVNRASKNGDNYTFNVVDPNSPSLTAKKLTFNASTGSLNLGNQALPALRVNTLDNFSLFEQIDIDGSYNIDNSSLNEASNTPSTYEEQIASGIINPVKHVDHLTIEIGMNGPFSIENDKGKKLTWDGQELKGDLERYDEYYVVRGNESCSCLVITIPYSRYVKYTSSHNNSSTDLCVMNEEKMINITGKGIDDLTIDIEKTCCNTYGLGSNIEFTYGTCNAQVPALIMSFEQVKDAGFKADSSNIEITGQYDHVRMKSMNQHGDFEKELEYTSADGAKCIVNVETMKVLDSTELN